MKARERADLCARLALEKKARDVVVLELSGLSDIADFFVLASGTSERHVRTVAEAIEDGTGASTGRPLSVEGRDEGRWAIIDYGDVIVHVFLESLRELYDLESLWIEAKRWSVE